MLDMTRLTPLQQQLNHHPIYEAVQSLDDLQIFMAHHVYPVWDFMSLVKDVQQQIAPAGAPWLPAKVDGALQRFINELVLEEESDASLPDANGEKTYTSHFIMYCQAMREVAADADTPLRFVDTVASQGLEAALNHPDVPRPAQVFMRQTFEFIHSNKPHVVAAALALGREHIIPTMFQTLLDKMGIQEAQAPVFHYYLQRHIFLDGDFHGPMSMRLLENLCGNNKLSWQEAEQAAVQAIQARIEFWDGVLASLAWRKQRQAA
jgi:hypothetical protein